MWKFKVSKYKNSAPKFPKREEWISDLPINNGFQSCGNHVAAGYSYMAFNVDNPGSLGVLPVDTKGRQGSRIPLLHCHGDFVTDFSFSPHDGQLLGTGSRDHTVKLWRLGEDWDGETSIQPCLLSQEESVIDNLVWHPLASSVLAVSTNKTIKIFNTDNQQLMFSSAVHGDMIQSFSWDSEGRVIVSSCKDKKLRVIDPRAATTVQEVKGHGGVRDSRVIWLTDTPHILSTGFSQMRNREISVWDSRALNSPVNTESLDTSTGTLMPLYDPDTNMLFIIGKGDTCIRFFETTEKHPIISLASAENAEQVKGACLVPKLKMDLMNAEVNRLLLMTKQAILPVPYQVPRKTYNEFYPELYPDTYSGNPSMTAEQWKNGDNLQGTKVSLDPKGTPLPSGKTCAGTSKAEVKTTSVTSPSASAQAPRVMNGSSTLATPHSSLHTTLNNTQEEVKAAEEATPDPTPAPAPVRITPKKPFAGVHHSKFRHLKATVLHRDHHIENIRNVSQSMPGESDYFTVNPQRAALPLAGSGGLIAVLELKDVGRLPDTGVPALQNGCMVMDFSWDPFDNYRLAVAGDDAKIRLWRIPEGGVSETLSQPEMVLRGHTEKVYFVRFHPLASDILASASYDFSVKIWNLATGQECIQLDGHTNTIFCLSWSPDGKKLATHCKDGNIRVYDPRRSTQPISEGPGPVGSRGARVEWVCGGMFLAASGFDKLSQRIIQVHDPMNLTGPLAQHDIDGSPAILVTHYDEDTSTLFLTGRGDSMVYTFEIHEDYPHIYALSPYHAVGLHQALSFLPKHSCDVRQVEFARAYRLTTTNMEPVSFTLPRVKMEYFQDDVFPETRVTWEPVMSSSEWLEGVNRLQSTLNLQPPDMMPLSEVPVEAPKPKKYESHAELTVKTDEQKKEELIGAMVKKLGVHEEPLPQDLTEGVDEDEWSD